jgi:hypothetical protein
MTSSRNPAKNVLESEGHEDSFVSNLTYIASGLAVGMYIVACLAIDLFVILQIYLYYPTEVVAVLSIFLAILLMVAEVRGFRYIKKFFSTR